MPAAARRALVLFATVLKGRGRAQDIHTESCRAYSKKGLRGLAGKVWESGALCLRCVCICFNGAATAGLSSFLNPAAPCRDL